MQHLYIRRIFSGWGLQLGLSQGLLLSSAGLAIALVFYTAAAADSTTGLKWKATSSLSHTRVVLSPEKLITTPLTSVAGEPRHYWVATTTAYQNLAATAAAPGLSEPEAGFDQANQASPNPVKATVQRSWTIIKLAFR